jgi:hypothetical protein
MASSSVSGKLHDGAELLLAEAGHRRCRLQGLKDASLHFGWVQESGKRSITVDVSSSRSIILGEFLYLEVSGPRALLTFIAYVAEMNGSLVKFHISSEIEQRSLKSESRVRVRTVDGEISGSRKGSPIPISILDVSEHGFGFVSQSPVQTSGTCKAVLSTVHGGIELVGHVRYARSDKTLMAYRGGMLILEMNRVSRARWTRLMEG